MGVAGGENAVGASVARILLHRDEEFLHRLLETPTEKMCSGDDVVSPTDAFARAEALRVFSVVDRGFEVSRQKPQAAANVPAAREARVERKCAIGQRHHPADVLSEERQRI